MQLFFLPVEENKSLQNSSNMMLWQRGEGKKSGEETPHDQVLVSADTEVYALGWKEADPSTKLGVPVQHGTHHGKSLICPPAWHCCTPRAKPQAPCHFRN